ncbi:MAG: hypothetical protein VKJ27_03415 [Synechocystis sp.]|nr:hypothetical protein [Synechocystis sp.]
MKLLLLTWLDRILVADVFIVLLGFFWFAIAVVGESTGVPLGYHLWQQLWIPVFNPAIGILILGALSSWLIKKIAAWITVREE